MSKKDKGATILKDKAQEATDLARDSTGQVSRLAMTFAYSCNEMQPVIGEIRYHEPLPTTSLAPSPTRID